MKEGGSMKTSRHGWRVVLGGMLLAGSTLVGGTAAHAQSSAQRSAHQAKHTPSTSVAVSRACRGRHTRAYFRKHHCMVR